MIPFVRPNKAHPFFLHFLFSRAHHFTTKTQLFNMEVEVKLRLKDSTSHQKLSTLLSPFLTKTLHQQNVFFDTKTSLLASKLSALRLRFYGLDSQCILSLKSKPKLSFGVSQVEEQEEPLDPILGRAFVNYPSGLLSLKGSKIIERVIDEFGVNGDVGLVCLGGFRNVRQVFVWNGLKLELDESIYSFGTNYEIECETSEPESDKKVIEEFLRENEIEFCYSDVNKFAVFRSGKLPEDSKNVEHNFFNGGRLCDDEQLKFDSHGSQMIQIAAMRPYFSWGQTLLDPLNRSISEFPCKTEMIITNHLQYFTEESIQIYEHQMNAAMSLMYSTDGCKYKRIGDKATERRTCFIRLKETLMLSQCKLTCLLPMGIKQDIFIITGDIIPSSLTRWILAQHLQLQIIIIIPSLLVTVVSHDFLCLS